MAPSLGSRRWVHTTYTAVEPYHHYFEEGMDGISYAIWSKREFSFTGDNQLEAYVEFHQMHTLKELQRTFGGYWNMAHFSRKENQLFHRTQEGITTGPWELPESPYETETGTHFIEIEYEVPPKDRERDEALEDTFSEEDEPEESTIVNWSNSEDMEDDSEEEGNEDDYESTRKKLKSSGYILDEALVSDS